MRVPGTEYSPTVNPIAPSAPQQTDSFKVMESMANIGNQEREKTAQMVTGLGQDALAVQAMQNEAEAKTLVARASGMYDSLLTDPNGGFLSKQGDAATKARDDTVQTINAIPQAVAGQASNDSVKEMIAPHMAMLVNSTMSRVNEHTSQQALASNIISGKLLHSANVASTPATFNPIKDTATINPLYDASAVHNLTDAQSAQAIMNGVDVTGGLIKYPFKPDDPASLLGGTTPLPGVPEPIQPAKPTTPAVQVSPYQDKLAQAKANLITQAQLEKVAPGAATDEYVREGMSNIYSATAEYLLNGGSKAATGQLSSADLDIAKHYYAAVKPALSPDQQKALEGQLAGAGQQTAVVSYVDNLMDSTHGYTAQMAQVRKDFESGKIPDGGQRELIESRLARIEEMNKRNTDQYNATLIGQAQDWIIKHPGSSVTSLPTPLYNAAKAGGHLENLDAFSKRENVTNQTTWFNTMSGLGSGGDTDISKMSDATWFAQRGNYSDADFKRFSQARDDMLNGTVSPRNDPGSLNLSKFNTNLTQRMAGIPGLVTKGANMSDEQKQRVGAIQQTATQWVLDEQAQAGHRFNDAEMRKSLDSFFMQGIDMPNGLIKSIWTRQQSTPTKMLNMTIDDIPDSAKEGIKQGLKSSGNPNPTDQDVLAQYWKLHAQHQRR